MSRWCVLTPEMPLVRSVQLVITKVEGSVQVRLMLSLFIHHLECVRPPGCNSTITCTNALDSRCTSCSSGYYLDAKSTCQCRASQLVLQLLTFSLSNSSRMRFKDYLPEGCVRLYCLRQGILPESRQYLRKYVPYYFHSDERSLQKCIGMQRCRELHKRDKLVLC